MKVKCTLIGRSKQKYVVLQFCTYFHKNVLLQNKLYWVIIAKKWKSRVVLKSHRKNVKTMATSIHVKHKYMTAHSPNYQFVY